MFLLCYFSQFASFYLLSDRVLEYLNGFYGLCSYGCLILQLDCLFYLYLGDMACLSSICHLNYRSCFCSFRLKKEEKRKKKKKKSEIFLFYFFIMVGKRMEVGEREMLVSLYGLLSAAYHLLQFSLQSLLKHRNPNWFI